MGVPLITAADVKAIMRRTANRHGSAVLATTPDGALTVTPHQGTTERIKRQAEAKTTNREKNRQARKTRRKQRGR